MNIRDLNKKNVPIVKIDRSLDKYAKKTLFPDKVKMANEMLKNVGLPNFNNTAPSRK